MELWQRCKGWLNSSDRNWTRTGVLVAVVAILVPIWLGQGSSDHNQKLPPAPSIGAIATPATSQPPSGTSTSVEPLASPQSTTASSAAPTPSETPSAQVPVRVPDTRSETTPLVLDLTFGNWGQVGPSTWTRKCCSFRIGTLLSDKFGEISGWSDCWITVGLIRNGVFEREVQGVCGQGWVDIYQEMSDGNYVLHFQATTKWGQELVQDKSVTILPAT